VIDEDIDGAKRVADLPKARLNCVGIRDVRRNAERVVAEVVREFLEVVCRTGEQPDLTALVDEFSGDRCAEAGTDAGDDGCLRHSDSTSARHKTVVVDRFGSRSDRQTARGGYRLWHWRPTANYGRSHRARRSIGETRLVGRSVSRDGTEHAARHRATGQHRGIDPGNRVLDVGCGTGNAALTARRAGANVVGLDLAHGMLELARDNASLAAEADIGWLTGDAEALPVLDDAFDVVLSNFGHVFAPDSTRAGAELRRVTKPGGRVCFTAWSPNGVVGDLTEVLTDHVAEAPSDPWSHLQWASLLSSATSLPTSPTARSSADCSSSDTPRHTTSGGSSPRSPARFRPSSGA